MKKTVLIAASILLISNFSGCYDGNDTAKVRIKLGNMPVAQNFQKKSIIDRVLCFFSKEAYALHPGNLIKIHLVALQGDSRVALKTINIDDVNTDPDLPIDTVDFEVPAAKNITIAILAERLEGSVPVYNDIYYYGRTDAPVDLIAGKDITVTISMVEMLDSSGTSNPPLEINFEIGGFSWKKLPGATRYNIYNGSGVLLESTTDPFTYNPGAAYMIIEFDYIDKKSPQIYFPV